jgi:hypothetical protein
VITAIVLRSVTETVDRMLLDDDQDGDGYITYPEFCAARFVARTLINGHKPYNIAKIPK